MELERLALEDSYFIDKKLYPNVDFYSGITLRAMGFPGQYVLPPFCDRATVGWIAHWKEMMSSAESKIGRPRQLYKGEVARPFTAVANREHTSRKISWAWLWGGQRNNET
ncbi:MAG: hypothetical protein CM1200mP41_18410 [Gammaproteobacteria bacterium]|nr:MAG: hypothetical protein CM1200mP41_18410 [Gammaproteobacteria bacterium]